MKKVIEFLQANPVQYLATVGTDGKAKARPFMFAGEMDGKLWFCTNSQKDMFKELSVNPYIDLCGSRLMENEIDTAWIRMSARVVFEENLTVKKMIMEKSSIVRQLYKNDANHSLFKVFYLSEISGTLNNLGHVKGLEENKAFSKPVVFNL